MPWSSANVALSREFPDVLVLLVLLWSTLGWLLAVALRLLWAEARLLRLLHLRLPHGCRLLPGGLPPPGLDELAAVVRCLEKYVLSYLSAHLAAWCIGRWVMDEHPVSCRWLETGDVPVQRFGIRNVTALKQSCTESRSIVHYGSRLLALT